MGERLRAAAGGSGRGRCSSAGDARRSPPRCHDAGMVTAELAVALPALVLVLVLAVNAVVIGIDQVRCTDAARVAARAAARGDTPAGISAVGIGHAPPGSRVGVGGGREIVAVTVSSPVRGPFAWLTGGRSLTSTAHAQRETASDP